MLTILVKILSLIKGKRLKRSNFALTMLALIELIIESIIVICILLLVYVSKTLNDTVTGLAIVENIDDLVKPKRYNSITSFDSDFLLTQIAKPPVVELALLSEEVLNQEAIRSLPNYKYLSKEFLIGFPCIESSGQMDIRTSSNSPSIFNDLVFASESETTDGFETKVKGIYQIKGAGKGSRWLQNMFQSMYATEGVSFTEPKRPHQFYLPDVVYSISYAFAKTEFNTVLRLYGTYIDKYSAECDLTEDQYKEIVQCLACAIYHGQQDSGGAVDKNTVRDTLVKFLCYAIKEVDSFKNLATLATDDFNTSVRDFVLGANDKGIAIRDNHKSKVKLTNGTYLNEPLITYISNKYSNGEILQVYLDLYRDTDTYQNQFANYAYGIGVISCGTMRLNVLDKFMASLNANVASNPMFRRVMEFMVSNGLHYTKYYVSLTGLDVKGQASSVQQIEASVQFNGNTYSFPMFCYDYSARKETGRIKIVYDIANHLDHRGFLYDIPDRLCVGGKNTAELRLTCDIRVIPALYTMARVWEEYDKLHDNTGERIVVVAAYRTTEKSTELMVSWANKLGLNNKTNWTMEDSDEIIHRAYNETGDLYNSLGAIELRRMAARPGNSPHQTGRVFDFSISDNPAIYDWLKENAHIFGFYPYTYEKWHWEYNPSRAEVSK